MSIELVKDSIDIGIVVRDGDAAMKFYRDTLRAVFMKTGSFDRPLGLRWRP